jgi:asparagine synthase (glutamine-hydrolysing)
MCGIAGCVVAPGREPDKAVLEKMGAALSHRGPDNRGLAVAENVGLVNTRLAIVDPSAAGHQPMSDPGGRWLLTYNGEIFNHASIRAELPIEHWRGGSDTESLLAALAAWDVEALERCHGFFAFAAFDIARGRLLLARDRFGVKPLYLAHWDGGLWFASEMRALIAAGIPARARRDVLARSATLGVPAGPQTPIEAIERLAPGSLLAVDTRTFGMAERRWYEPKEPVDPELATELATLSRAELSERLETELRGAVRRRLLGDVPMGTACSGGIDSTLVTALARDEDPSVIAFNASLVDEGRTDEGRWAEVAARALDVELETVRITAEDWRAALVGAVAHHEYPLSESCTSGPLSLVAQRAHRRGVKVMLTGEAADELFGSYPLNYGRHFRRFLPAPQFAKRVVDAARAPQGISRIRWALLYRLRNGPGPASGGFDLPLEAARWQDSIVDSARRAYAHHPGTRGELEASLLSALWLGGFRYLLTRMDKAPMTHSVETRIPYLDQQVVELVVNLPLEHRIGPSLKGLLRDVAQRRLPRSIVRRPKQYGMAFGAGRRIEQAARPTFLEHGYLRDLLQLPADRWDRLIARVGRNGRFWTAEIWCRLFLDGQGVASVERDLWAPERM